MVTTQKIFFDEFAPIVVTSCDGSRRRITTGSAQSSAGMTAEEMIDHIQCFYPIADGWRRTRQEFTSHHGDKLPKHCQAYVEFHIEDSCPA